MAGSFSLFRRNQKLMLAILTLLAMFAFVFLDPLLKLVGNNRAPSDPVLVETRYGDLKRSDISNLKSRRGLVQGFLDSLAQTTVQKAVDRGELDLRSPGMVNYFTGQLRSEFVGRIMRSQDPLEERAVVDTMLLARKANAMGIVVSDSAILANLYALTQNAVNAADMSRIISSMRLPSGARLSEAVLFDALRTELAASALATNFGMSLNALPPGEAWDYFKRLSQKATIEAIAVPVADFTSQVKEPAEQTLVAFFKEHQNQIAVPGSPVPGFKYPRRQQFQYFKAEFDLFLQTAEVSEEEIKEYYEANRTSFRKLALPKDPEPEDEGEATPEAEAPVTEENKDTPAEADDKADGETTGNDQPTEEAAPTTDEPKTDEPAGEAAKPEGQESSSLQRRAGQVKFRLVADEKTVDDAPAAAEPALEAPTADAPAADEPAADASAEGTDAAPSEEAEDKADDKAEESSADKADTDEPAEPQYSTLEEVRDKIEQTLKSEKAAATIRKGMNEIAATLGAYSQSLNLYNVRKESDSSLTPPREPDFIALAKKFNFVFEESHLVSYFELSSAQGLGTSRVGEVPYALLVFQGQQPLYSPIESEDTDRNAYLSWKIEDLAEKVPDFAEVRDQVLKTWKQIEARDLARKQAEKLAEQARKSGKSLTETFSGDSGTKVLLAGPFSWMTLGTTAENALNRVPMLSEVPGIVSPAADFMRATFALEKGGVGVAMNGPQSVCYVIQLTDYQPPIEELEADFARANVREYLQVVARDKQQLYQEWLEDLERDAGVKWLREPGTSAMEE